MELLCFEPSDYYFMLYVLYLVQGIAAFTDEESYRSFYKDPYTAWLFFMTNFTVLLIGNIGIHFLLIERAHFERSIRNIKILVIHMVFVFANIFVPKHDFNFPYVNASISMAANFLSSMNCLYRLMSIYNTKYKSGQYQTHNNAATKFILSAICLVLTVGSMFIYVNYSHRDTLMRLLGFLCIASQLCYCCLDTETLSHVDPQYTLQVINLVNGLIIIAIPIWYCIGNENGIIENILSLPNMFLDLDKALEPTPRPFSSASAYEFDVKDDLNFHTLVACSASFLLLHDFLLKLLTNIGCITIDIRAKMKNITPQYIGSKTSMEYAIKPSPEWI